MDFRQNNTYDISQLHYKAKRCLVLRQFEEAAQICCEVLDLQENGEKTQCRLNETADERWNLKDKLKNQKHFWANLHVTE